MEAEEVSKAARKMALSGIRKRAKTAKLRTKIPADVLKAAREALGLEVDDDEDATEQPEEG